MIATRIATSSPFISVSSFNDRRALMLIKGPGDLVDVRSDLSQFAQQPRQLRLLHRRLSHRARPCASRQHSARKGSDAHAGFPCRRVELLELLRSEADRKWLRFRVGNLAPALPGSGAFRLLCGCLCHASTLPSKVGSGRGERAPP